MENQNSFLVYKPSKTFKIGERLVYYRKKFEMSQEDLAEKIASHRECISRIERGLIDVRLSTLIKIARAFEVELSELIAEK